MKNLQEEVAELEEFILTEETTNDIPLEVEDSNILDNEFCNPEMY
jgi:hypothetical protein